MTTIAQVVLDTMNGIPQEVPAAKKKGLKPAPVITEAIRARRAEIQSSLRSGIWTVEFTKVDGTSAIMECTLDPRHLPSDPNVIKPMPDPDRTASEHLIHAYAIDRQGWRSFYVSNVTKLYRQLESL